MSEKRIDIPQSPAVLHERARDFAASYGLPLIAGGESPGGAPAVTTPPGPAPAAAPAQAAPAQPTTPASPGTPGAPAAPADPIAALQQGQQALLERLDDLAPPAPVDPLEVELGLVPAPPQAPPGQPDPFQSPQTAGLPQPGAPQQPGAISTPPGLDVNPNDPAQVAQLRAVEGFIDQRAQEIAKKAIDESFTPYVQSQERARKQAEAAQVVEQHPQLQDPTYRQSVIQQARRWARDVTGSEDAAAEPGWIEMTHLAMSGLALSQQAAPGGQPGGAEVPIEGGGAAQPTATQTDSQKIAQEIVAAKPGGGLNSFWNG